jgi:hypothetical protein
LRTAAPDRRPHTAPDLLPVAYPRSREHDEEPLQGWRSPDPSKINFANFSTLDKGAKDGRVISSTEVTNQTEYDVNTEYLDTRSRSSKLTVVVTAVEVY